VITDAGPRTTLAVFYMMAAEPGNSPEEDRRNTLTYVLVKDDAEWRIASFHNAQVSGPSD